MRLVSDHLQVRHAPEVEQVRPRPVTVLAPDPEQRHAVVDLRRLEQPLASDRAAPSLPPLQRLEVFGRLAPELPSGYAGGMPGRPLGRRAVGPEVPMPAEAEHGLAANDAVARPPREGFLAERSRRQAE